MWYYTASISIFLDHLKLGIHRDYGYYDKESVFGAWDCASDFPSVLNVRSLYTASVSSGDRVIGNLILYIFVRVFRVVPG